SLPASPMIEHRVVSNSIDPSASLRVASPLSCSSPDPCERISARFLRSSGVAEHAIGEAEHLGTELIDECRKCRFFSSLTAPEVFVATVHGEDTIASVPGPRSVWQFRRVPPHDGNLTSGRSWTYLTSCAWQPVRDAISRCHCWISSVGSSTIE